MILAKLLEEKDPLNKQLSIDVRDICQIHCKILANKSLDENLRKSILEVYSKDLDDNLRNNKLKIDAMLADDQERNRLWADVLFNKNRSVSYVELQKIASGYISGAKSTEMRRGLVDHYCRDMPELLKNQGKLIGKVMLIYFIPNLIIESDTINKLNGLLEVVQKHNNSYFIDILVSQISEFEKRFKCYCLYN